MLLAAFKQISIENVQEHRKLALWEDFLEHLEAYITMATSDRFEFSEKAQLYLAHQPMIDDLTTTFEKEWAKAVAYLEARFLAGAKGGPWHTGFTPRVAWMQASRSHWSSSDLFIHFEWYLPVSGLVNGIMPFWVDVEGKMANKALALFDSRHQPLEPLYLQRNIEYRPSSRRHAIASKNYPISQDMDAIAEVFITSFEEFRFLENEVDEVLAEMESK
jgi:hypothetical protein